MSENQTRPLRARNDDPPVAEADRYDQRREIIDQDAGIPGDIPDDVDPADAQEQQVSVPYDEDDYR
jgi:hypothetical protein